MMRPAIFLPSNRVRRHANWLFLMVAAVGSISPVLAVTPGELQGDYRLTALTIYYGGFPPTIDENDFPSLTGYFSATGKTLLFEHGGQDNVSHTTYQQRTAGIYQLFGNVATVLRVNGIRESITLQLPSSNTLIVAGSAVDSNNQTYRYTYTFSRVETYYTQAQLDVAIEDATAGLFTQEQVDAAVAEALANVKPRVVVIPLGD